jgi:hypothetical protein
MSRMGRKGDGGRWKGESGSGKKYKKSGKTGGGMWKKRQGERKRERETGRKGEGKMLGYARIGVGTSNGG